MERETERYEPRVNENIIEPLKVSSSVEESKEIMEKEQKESEIGQIDNPITPISVVIDSDYKKVFNNVEGELSYQKEKHQKVWEPVIATKEHSILEQEYHKISPKGVVFFDVENQKQFRQETKRNYEALSSRYNIEVVERWNEDEMDRMFGKGLNPTSLITSLESAQWFEKKLESKQAPVLELGPGSGWSTVMLYNTLKEGNPQEKAKIISVDMSAHAIAATQTLLEYSDIPYITLSAGEDLKYFNEWVKNTKEGMEFSGIILVRDTFENAIKNLPDEILAGAYSSHGSSYLSKSEYTTVLDLLQSKLKKSGIFIADSLNPLYTNKLNKLLTISQMVFPKLVQKILDRRGIKYIEKKDSLLRSKSKYFPGEEVKVLQGFNTPHAYLIFKWCNYLIRSGQIGRLSETKKSLEVTMDVVEAYRDDVYPSYLLEEQIIKKEGFKYTKLEDRPDFPIFMDTQGFRLNS